MTEAQAWARLLESLLEADLVFAITLLGLVLGKMRGCAVIALALFVLSVIATIICACLKVYYFG